MSLYKHDMVPGPQGRESLEHPRAFHRRVVLPTGLPWDQVRAAQLEAQHGSPLPITELVYQVRRVDSWSPGAPSRFDVFYLRASEVGSGIVARAVVDGAPMDVAFVPAGERSRQVQSLAAGLAVAAVALVSVLGAATHALEVRRRSTAALDALEISAARQDHQVRARRELIRQLRTLNGARSAAVSPDAFLADLAWASASKAPGAHIEAYHWDHGYMAVEVRGEAKPFQTSGRHVVRAPKPLRRGVWLWAVAPPAGGPQSR